MQRNCIRHTRVAPYHPTSRTDGAIDEASIVVCELLWSAIGASTGHLLAALLDYPTCYHGGCPIHGENSAHGWTYSPRMRRHRSECNRRNTTTSRLDFESSKPGRFVWARNLRVGLSGSGTGPTWSCVLHGVSGIKGVVRAWWLRGTWDLLAIPVESVGPDSEESPRLLDEATKTLSDDTGGSGEMQTTNIAHPIPNKRAEETDLGGSFRIITLVYVLVQYIMTRVVG